MIRTKKHILNEIKRNEKLKKKLKLELYLLEKTGGTHDLFTETASVLSREIIKIEGKLEGLLWQAHTNEKSLPKLKKKRNVKKTKTNNSSTPEQK